MKLSVAMCTYNGAAYLRQQLASIAEQTRRPDELVVCDDASHDGTQEIVAAFAAAASFPVRLYTNQKNLGSNKNFEQAIRLCNGEVIALCDQDDIWHPEKLALTEAVFSAHPEIGLLFTNAEVVDENLGTADYSLWEGVGFSPDLQAKVRAGRAFEALIERASVTGATMAFRTRFSNLVLPIPDDLDVVHDEWIALLIAAAGQLAMVDKSMIKYRRHSHQQIGVNQPDLGPVPGKLNQVRKAIKRKNLFSSEINKLHALGQRLHDSSKDYPCSSSYRMVQDRASHLEARANILERGMRSVPSVLRELITLRYHRYSRGLYSAVKDLRWLSSSHSQSSKQS